MNIIKNGEPTAHITVNRSRLKTYGNTIYFKNDSHYEIELFNPLAKRVLVKIEIDGRTISSTGLILNPGQRAYLERWIDDSKKFLFSTYEVENTPEAKAAVQNNGKIKVSFYAEQDNYFVTNGIQSIPINTFYYSNNGDAWRQSYYSCGTLSSSFTGDAYKNLSNVAGSLETGRTEMGDKSSQVFEQSNGTFNSWTTSVCEWQLLPESQKPIEISHIREYCHGCGNRIRKQTWKFCPACGEEL